MDDGAVGREDFAEEGGVVEEEADVDHECLAEVLSTDGDGDNVLVGAELESQKKAVRGSMCRVLTGRLEALRRHPQG